MKNAINKVICYANAFILLYSIAAIDSDYHYVCLALVSFGILTLYGVANGWIE